MKLHECKKGHCQEESEEEMKEEKDLSGQENVQLELNSSLA